jgi:hypothetical protein
MGALIGGTAGLLTGAGLLVLYLAGRPYPPGDETAEGLFILVYVIGGTFAGPFSLAMERLPEPWGWYAYVVLAPTLTWLVLGWVIGLALGFWRSERRRSGRGYPAGLRPPGSR